MKKTVSMLLALVMVLALCVPVLAAEASPVRLAQVDSYENGELVQQTKLSYYEGTRLQQQDETQYIYDEDGQLRFTAQTVTSYDEDGRTTIVDTTTTNGSGEVVYTEQTVYVRDSENVLLETVTESGLGDDTEISVVYYDFEYDDQGRVAVETQTSNGEVVFIREFTYDDQGRVAAALSRMSEYGWSYFNEYTYDDAGRMIANRLTYDNGTPGSYLEYAFEPDPYFDLRYSLHYMDGAVKPSFKPSDDAFYAEVPAAAGQPELSFSLQDTPQLTYDEAGYLVLADAGNGNSLQFTYEPAA